MEFVKGSYNTVEEAQQAVQELKEKGYREDQIRLVANDQIREAFLSRRDVDVSSVNEVEREDESFWDKIVNAFTVEDNYDHVRDFQGDILAAHQSDIDAGKVVVIVDDERSASKEDNDKDSARVELKEEQLDVNKREVETGEVNVSKRVVEDKESVDVPVEREQVVIERRKVDDKKVADENFKDEEYSIPLSREEVDVNKEAVVTEEVEIGKRTVRDTEHVERDVKREELDVETEGDVNVDRDKF